MQILRLELENIRNFKSLNFNFNNQLTTVYGGNAQGKTSLLEAIYFLTLTKSPRKIKDKDIILKGETRGKIKGIFKKQNEDLEIEFLLGSSKIGKINKKPSLMKEVLGQVFTVLFTVEDLDIIENPSRKRRFLNILLSLLDKSYFLNLLEYQKVLKRRNKTLFLIKTGKSTLPELDFWDEEIASLGAAVSQKRKEIILKINKLLKENSLFFKTPLTLRYRTKALLKEDLKKKLKENRDSDIILTQTTLGPHRDIVEFYANNFNLQLYGSRGEKRGAIIELKKAEIDLIKEEKKETPIFLLDDVFSELDLKNKKQVLKLIKDQQTILTTTDLNQLNEDIIKRATVYKIENGGLV